MTISTINEPIIGSVTIKEGKRSHTYVTGSTSYNPLIQCGDCNRYAKAHPVFATDFDGNNVCVCPRNKYEVGDPYSPRYDSTESGRTDHLQGIELQYLSGPNPDPNAKFDHWAIEPEIANGYDGEYRDLDPDEQTVTLDQYRNGKRPNTTYEVQRSEIVDQSAGFITVEAYDPVLTEKYALRLLNVFRSKGKWRCGSIEITHNTDASVTARCVKCNARMTATKEVTRDEMEDFTLSVIRHGNNHAAAWFINRPEFYKVHASRCDGTCGENQVGCNESKLASNKELEELRSYYLNH